MPKSAQPIPSPPPTVTDAREERRKARVQAAQNFTINYLNSWSAPNADALDATAELYAPRVLFHGRAMNVRSLLKEKRRFVRRWPERQYRPREGTIQVACEPEDDVCAVQSLFDFSAANPRRDRRSQGIAALQLVISFMDDHPVISAESSMVLGRSGDEENMTLEETTDD